MILEGHHSRSVLPAQARKRLQLQASTTMRSQGGWWCESCKRMVKQTANFCPTCGGAWGQTGPSTYANRPDWGATQWQGGWRQPSKGTWQQPKSPRRRPSPGRAKGGKAKEATAGPVDGGTAKGAKDHKGKGAAVPTAPAIETLPSPPSAPSGLDKVPPATPLQAEVSPEKAAYQQLLQALAGQKETLPEDIRRLVDQQSIAAGQDSAKSLHRTVTAQATARRELQRTRNARSTYMQAWSSYIGQLRDLLEEQVRNQQEHLEQLDTQEMQWSGRLQEASTTLTRLANEGFQAEIKEIRDSESDMEMAEQRVDDAIALEQELRNQQAVQQQAAKDLLAALGNTRDQAAEEAAKAQRHATEGRAASRTPRRGKTAENSVAVDSSPDATVVTGKDAKQGAKLPDAAVSKTPPQQARG